MGRKVHAKNIRRDRTKFSRQGQRDPQLCAQYPVNLQIRFHLTGVSMYICNAELTCYALHKRGQIRLWGCRLLIPVTVEIMGI